MLIKLNVAFIKKVAWKMWQNLCKRGTTITCNVYFGDQERYLKKDFPLQLASKQAISRFFRSYPSFLTNEWMNHRCLLKKIYWFWITIYIFDARIHVSKLYLEIVHQDAALNIWMCFSLIRLVILIEVVVAVGWQWDIKHNQSLNKKNQSVQKHQMIDWSEYILINSR